MSDGLDSLSPPQALIEAARNFHQRGWMAGTAGNLSIRTGDNCWITASGRPKGYLGERDLLQVAVATGQVVKQHQPQDKPSAETAIHLALYRLFPQIQAVFHVHTVESCLAANAVPTEALALPLPPLEMIKGLGVWEEHPQVALPLFANYLDISRIAEAMVTRFNQQLPVLPGLMIRNHGTTVWGDSPQQTYNRLEALEFILSYLARSQ